MSDFLNDCALRACALARPTIESLIANDHNRKALVAVILRPQIPYHDGPDLPVLHQGVFGVPDHNEWSKPFEEFARAKARLCWRTGRSSRDVGENAPHLLNYDGHDIKYPGGVVDNGLIVAASGLDWQYDEAAARIIIALFQAQLRFHRDFVMDDSRRDYI